MMHLLLGFVIALAVGLTGIGGGSFTVPALLLIVGLPAGEAVGATTGRLQIEMGTIRSVAQTVRVDIHKLDRLMNIVGELSIVRTSLARLVERLRAQHVER